MFRIPMKLLAKLVRNLAPTSKINCRNLCMASLACKEPQEIVVPTSYGHISGKMWGPEDGKKIVALHGWQDNCGTFDTLIPLLPKNLRIVAIDFPGHGFSSHKPLGATYNFLDHLIDIKTVVRHLNWNRFSLMGHSMGGANSIFYASCFPEEIDGLVTLDSMDTDIIPSYKYPERTAQMVNKFLSVHEKLTKPPPIYSYDNAFKRLLEGQKEFMTSKGVKFLMKRAVKPSVEDQNSFVFTRDLRVQVMCFLPTDSDVWIQYLQNLSCHFLRIKAIDGLKRRRSDVHDFLFAHYRNRSETLQVIEVEGLHHVHLEHPERLAPHISAFFTSII